MSTLRADTIQSTGGGAATLTKQIAAKGRINYDQDVPEINDSLNISSASDHGAGNFTTAYTNSYTDANYSCANMTNNVHFIALEDSGDETTETTSSDCEFNVCSHSGSLADNTQNMITWHGDLA
jgi:hypothetical protein